MLKRYIGDRAFYRQVFAVVLPIIVQNAITNFVSLLDNIMVGQVGTLPMSGVSIVNQLMFVFNLCIFGAASGAGIFTAQFHGSGDSESVRHTLRFKILSCLLLVAVGCGVFLAGGDALIRLYLQGEGNPADAAAALEFGREYLLVMLFGLLPFALTNAYSGTLRETGQTVVPMGAGVVAVVVNLILNYILIFGKLGFEPMGVRGAAVATVISRFVELGVVAVYAHIHTDKYPFFRGVYRSFRIPGELLGNMIRKALPLLLNECLWASGMAVINQCYSTCGLDVVPAQNISSTIYNLAGVGYFSTGNAVGIIMGQMLGANRPVEELKDTNRKLIATSCFVGFLFGSAMGAVSTVFPGMYNTTEKVQLLATRLICVSAAIMPFNAYTHASYFTLRSGGQTLITFLFDSCFVWFVVVPLAACLCRFSPLSMLAIYAICQGTDLIKCVIGAMLLKKGVWIRNLTRIENE